MNASLGEQTGAAVATIFAHFLHDASHCVLMLHLEKDKASLHDFRVSIRRLRIWCKLVKDEELAPVAKSCITRLKNLVSLTNEARDLDVHIEFLKQSFGLLSAREKKAVLKTENKWKRKTRSLRKKVAQEIARLFPPLDAECAGLISDIASGKGRKLKFDPWIASVFAKYGKRLDMLISGIGSVRDEEKIHKSRLCAKALRYLLEPFTHENAEALGMVEELRRMQDLVGGLRDMQTLVQSLKVAKNANDLQTVLKRAQGRKKALFRKFQQQYLSRPDFQNKTQLLFASEAEQP